MRIEPIAIGEIDVEPAIVVVVEKGDPASFGLDDETFVLDPAPDVGNMQAGLAGHIEILDRGRSCGSVCGFNDDRMPPFPNGSRDHVKESAAECKRGGTNEMSA